MGEVVIEPATRDDVDAVGQLESECFPEPWRPELFGWEIGVQGRYNLVAKRDGVLIGYVFTMSYLDELHVNKIAVAEHERRKGIAEELMSRCIAFARKRGVKTIYLEVRKSNHGAQAFYRRIGFVASYERPRYYPNGETAVVMTYKM